MLTGHAKQWGLFVGLGITSVILGIIAWIDAISVTLASTVVIGVVVLIAGVVQCVHAFSVRQWGGFLFSLIGGILYALCGVLIVKEPVTGSVIITVLISLCLIIGGLSRCFIAFRFNNLPGWWIGLLSGLTAIFIGIALYMTLPWSGLWLIGIMISCELIIAGISWIQTGFAMRRGQIPPSSPF
ncbi:HdeD family acid-resistance protein [Acetobacter sp. AN02]|uniref:HdeD family acid-resistance protein n=1 Tax=Acetobacter sp. AN02 TaxID=2894186 RepID=UPI0024346028|nr:HdeD family acid-resistance protein [Acetobacter sp. AN02]MDG6095280.1 HdeD family acid-resistance protein [Acetobacter sp. AN02]